MPNRSQPSVSEAVDPLVEIARLRRDLTSARTRNAVLLRAVNGTATAVSIALIRGQARLEPTLRIAQLLDAQGRVPVVSWARDPDGTIIGIELAVLSTDAERAASADAPSADMGVLA